LFIIFCWPIDLIRTACSTQVSPSCFIPPLFKLQSITNECNCINVKNFRGLLRTYSYWFDSFSLQNLPVLFSHSHFVFVHLPTLFFVILLGYRRLLAATFSVPIHLICNHKVIDCFCNLWFQCINEGRTFLLSYFDVNVCKSSFYLILFFETVSMWYFKAKL
jgi:hypothetical protein